MNDIDKGIADLAGQVRAFQEIRQELAGDIEARMPKDYYVSAAEIKSTWRITSAVLRRLVTSGWVKTRRTSKKPNARCKYSVCDVLTTTIRDGRHATGRIKNRCSGQDLAGTPDH